MSDVTHGLSPQQWLETASPEELLQAAGRMRDKGCYLVEDLFLHTSWEHLRPEWVSRRRSRWPRL